jgi:hypothetical protein
MCPSGSPEEILQTPNAGVATAIFFANTGSSLIPGNPDWIPGVVPVSAFGPGHVGLTNYMGCGGVFGSANGSWGGVFFPQYKGMMLTVTKTELNIVTLEAVSSADGTSNTLMVGESIGGSAPGSPSQIGFGWISSGSRPTFSCIPDSLRDVYWFDWSSMHAGMVVNFAMGDASVRGVRPTGREKVQNNSGFPHNPLTAAEKAFWAISGYADGDTSQANGINE